MNTLNFRKLRADEIECRVGTVKEGLGFSLLLYKDARCDQRLLDETVGAMSWQRDHQLIGDRLFCTVSIKDPESGEWIRKQDVGTESFTEKEKGEASDSFKRACFNWGIGRELYSAPFIWISGDGRKKRYDVSKINYSGDRISGLEIIEERSGKVVFEWGDTIKAPRKKSDDVTKGVRKDAQKLNNFDEFINSSKISAIRRACKNHNIPEDKVLALYGITDLKAMTIREYADFVDGKWKELTNEA